MDAVLPSRQYIPNATPDRGDDGDEALPGAVDVRSLNVYGGGVCGVCVCVHFAATCIETQTNHSHHEKNNPYTEIPPHIIPYTQPPAWPQPPLACPAMYDALPHTSPQACASMWVWLVEYMMRAMRLHVAILQ